VTSQILKYEHPTQRKFVLNKSNLSDFDDHQLVSIVAAVEREVDIRPFHLVDKENQVSPEIRNYSKGRKALLPSQLVTFAKNVKVSGTGLIISNDERVLRESSIREHHAYRKSDEEVEIRNSDEISHISKRISEPTIVLTGVWPLHFSHWMFDNFAKLCYAKKLLGNLSNYKIAVGFGSRRGGWMTERSFQYQCLSFLGFAHENIVPLHEEKWYEFDDAILLTESNNFKPPVDKIYSDPEIFEFFNSVYSLSGLERKPAVKKVHLSRTDEVNRRCVNEEAVIKSLAPLGFKEKIISGMSMKEQMAFFSEIRIGCGPIGNNLISLFSMQPGSKLVTYFPKQASHFLSYYQSFCSYLGVDLFAICGTEVGWEGPKSQLDNLRWDVDHNEVLGIIEGLDR